MKGSTNSIYKKNGPSLLWTNASPSAKFSGQTITLTNSAADYTFIVVEFKNYYNDSELDQTGILRKGDTMACLYSGNYYRAVTSITDSSVTFDNAYDYDQERSTTSYIIPLTIYGLA